MHHAHAAGAEPTLEPVLPRVFRMFRFRVGPESRSGGMTHPRVFVRSRNSVSLVDPRNGDGSDC